MFKKCFFIIFIALFANHVNASVEGYWRINNYPSSMIHIYISSENKLEGELIFNNYNSLFALDYLNETEEGTYRKLLGLKLFSGFSQKNKHLWKGGKIYNPQDGESYNARVKLIEKDQIKLTGYIITPLFSRSLTLTRLNNPLEILEMAYRVYDQQYHSIKPTPESKLYSDQEKSYYILDRLQEALLEHKTYFEKKYLDLKEKTHKPQ